RPRRPAAIGAARTRGRRGRACSAPRGVSRPSRLRRAAACPRPTRSTAPPSLSGRMRFLLVLLIAVALAGCGSDRPAAPPRAQGPVPSATPAPAPDAGPGGLAGELTRTWTTLRAGIRTWLARDGGASLPPAGVADAADAHERLYLRLAGRPRLAARVVPQLHGRL